MNIEFEIPLGQSNTPTQAIWSGDDLEGFFEEVEQSDEFKLIAPKAVIKLSIAFDKV